MENLLDLMLPGVGRGVGEALALQPLRRDESLKLDALIFDSLPEEFVARSGNAELFDRLRRLLEAPAGAPRADLPDYSQPLLPGQLS